jgi:ABC-type Fe3+/spermidine/putrescine transport system ATPase subunit
MKRDDNVTLVLRPEAIRLHRTAPAGAANVLRGQITTMSFLGTLARYWVRVNEATWMVDVPAPGERVLTGEVFLEIPRERIHILKSDS